MNSIGRDIFKAIHEGKWLSIEYKNKSGQVTHYWIGIKKLFPNTKTLLVDGLHLGTMELAELNIYIDSIVSSSVVDGTYCAINHELVLDIRMAPEKYADIFSSVANLKILNYLEDCHRLDNVPYKAESEYALISQLDADKFVNKQYTLTPEQFKAVVDNFQFKINNNKKNGNSNQIKKLAINELSINTKDGLYVLVYKWLFLDVKNRRFTEDDEFTFNTEYMIDGQTKCSINQFMQPEDLYLLDDYKNNAEVIKDLITRGNQNVSGVDDMPYLIAIGMNCLVDLHKEYEGIFDMYDNNETTPPFMAFFGSLTRRPRRFKQYPVVLKDRRVNLDQLLAINNAVKYPMTYIQGPPGTGKTSTIENTILTAFFNDKSVLFCSYNNHPIDGVCHTLQNLKYKDRVIPFPIVRLGNNEVLGETVDYIRRVYNAVKDIEVNAESLEREKSSRVDGLKEFSELMERYEERLDYVERKETLEDMIANEGNFTFKFSLQSYQLPGVNAKLAEIGEITNEDALALIPEDDDSARQYLYYASVECIQRLGKNKPLLEIIRTEDKDEAVEKLNKFLSNDTNFKRFIKIFPIVATTSISAHKLGEPKPYFDMVIMDEASQGNIAVSLVPIIRGTSLVLVGDPQQLNPVILLDQKSNDKLRAKYGVSDEYDYINNSIYKTYLACDSVSDEILLSYHYRCDPRIIGFNNKKYYNNKLNVKTEGKGNKPLIFTDVTDDTAEVKNSAPREAELIVRYAKEHPDVEFGIITPFVNQRTMIEHALRDNEITNATCGTVHAFQGDEKDVIIFSLALTNKTTGRTYEWLKNNKELINVATSRAKDKLIVLGSQKELDRLHSNEGPDDLYELVDYTRTVGETVVTPRVSSSRALGIKPYSTKTESAFLENLNHALENIESNGKKCRIVKEVAISQVFENNTTYDYLFYTGRFDFVVYERISREVEIPILAIELDGMEHREDEDVIRRDEQKNRICRDHGFELIRIENSYARRYNYIKDILIQYFSNKV